MSFERSVSGRPGAEGADAACLFVLDGWDEGGAIRMAWDS